jgi:hypothetical protein
MSTAAPTNPWESETHHRPPEHEIKKINSINPLNSALLEMMEGRIMRNMANHIGIGCFAQGDTLRRVLTAALENFTLSKYEDFCHSADRVLNDKNLAHFFRSVVHSGTEQPHQAELVLKCVPESAKINGFFLGVNRQALHLVIFFLDGGHQQTRLTTRLEKFSRLRKKRLH